MLQSIESLFNWTSKAILADMKKIVANMCLRTVAGISPDQRVHTGNGQSFATGLRMSSLEVSLTSQHVKMVAIYKLS